MKIVYSILMHKSCNCIVSTANTTQSPTQLRLAGGSHELEGRVEILYAGLWGVICSSFGFDLANANVICRQLGYPGALRVAYFYEFYKGTGQIWLTNVDCTGNESALEDCAHSGFRSDRDYCIYGEIGVECIGMFTYSIIRSTG